MAFRRVPLLLAAALLVAGVTGADVSGAAADRAPWPGPAPRVTVRAPVPPKGVTARPGRVTVPKVSARRRPVPRVSISVPPRQRRAAPQVALPRVTVYRDGLCTGGVRVGECPRGRVRVAPRPVPQAGPVRVPTLTPAPSPTPTPSVSGWAGARRPLPPPGRRDNPLGGVLLTVVLVTAITSTTAVAFRSRR
ncbi:hypothetical protein [Nonomuraea sp. B1E8]|uniref:hypothetical protein n=1 Tax=unclassified Nonomuraea TaxID=2593643 RepID=UPI00325EDD8E